MKAKRRVDVSSDSSNEDCRPKDQVASSGGGVKASKSSSKQHQEFGRKKRALTKYKEESVSDQVESSSMVQKYPIAKKQKTDDGDAAPTSRTLRENPNTLIDWKSLVPRWHGKQSEWQKFCDRFLAKIYSSKNRRFAQVFYLPVDPIKLNLFDYWDVVKTPMDLQTIKNKLDYKQYVKPGEFASDMNLMIDNCCRYNPKQLLVHQNALELKTFFDKYWKDLPRFASKSSASESDVNRRRVTDTPPIDESFKKKFKDSNGPLLAQAFSQNFNVTPAPTIRENPNTLIDWETLEPRWHGKKQDWQKFCSELLADMHSSKNERFVRPFYLPVDARRLNLSNYWDIVKTPMDLQTIEMKLKHKQYVAPEEFASDMHLIINNCCKYNPKHLFVYQNALELKKLFEKRWKLCPKPQVQRPRQENSEKIEEKRSSNARYELSIRMNSLPEIHIYSCLRIIQIGQHEADEDVMSLRSLCDNEIDFTEISDDIIQELLEYISAVDSDEAKVANIMKNLEEKAKSYGVNHYDDILGFIPKKALKRASNQNRMSSDSASLLATSFGDTSSRSTSNPKHSSMSVSKNLPIHEAIAAPPRPSFKSRVSTVKAPSSSSSTKVSKPAVKTSAIPVQRSRQDNSKVVEKKLRPNARQYIRSRMHYLPGENNRALLRIIQIEQHKADQDVFTFLSLTENHEFSQISDDIIQEVLKYLKVVDVNQVEAARIGKDLENKSEYCGINFYDNMLGFCPKEGLKPISKRHQSPVKIAPPPAEKTEKEKKAHEEALKKQAAGKIARLLREAEENELPPYNQSELMMDFEDHAAQFYFAEKTCPPAKQGKQEKCKNNTLYYSIGQGGHEDCRDCQKLEPQLIGKNIFYPQIINEDMEAHSNQVCEEKAKWDNFCKRLLSEILENESFSRSFYFPFEPDQFNLLGWYVVKTPMDLQTIEKKLKAKQYVEPEEFTADIYLMLDNYCKNVPDPFIFHKIALDLKALADKRWKLFPKTSAQRPYQDRTKMMSSFGFVHNFPSGLHDSQGKSIGKPMFEPREAVMKTEGCADSGTKKDRKPDEMPKTSFVVQSSERSAPPFRNRRIGNNDSRPHDPLYPMNSRHH